MSIHDSREAPEPQDESAHERLAPTSPSSSEASTSRADESTPPQVESATNADAALPEDLRSPLGWSDLFLLVFFYFVSGVALTLMVRAAAAQILGISWRELGNDVTAMATVVIASQALLSGATVLYLYLVVRSRSSRPFWPAMGWHQFHHVASRGATAMQYMLGGVALALGTGIVSRYFGNTPDLPIEEMFRSRQSVMLLMALGILVAPLVEETVFRGCVYPVFARRFGIGAGVVVTGALFGLAHAEQLWGGWGQIVLLVCVGMILTYVRARAGTVAASYFVHLGYNGILFAGFYFATGGLRHFPGS